MMVYSMKHFISLFSSVKLAIFLIIIITSAFILGTLIPQNREAEFYRIKYGEWAGPISALQLNRLYGSWWFIGLLFLFALNLIICTQKRFFAKLRRFRDFDASHVPGKLKGLQTTENLETAADRDTFVPRLRRELIAQRYRVRQAAEEESAYLAARKKSLGRFGAEVVHAGLLIILAGGIISGIFGFSTNLVLSENETVSVPHSEFDVRLDSFHTEFYPDGSPKDWKSAISIYKEDKKQTQKTIEVNHPLSYQGFLFYQSGYGWDWERSFFELTLDNLSSKQNHLKIRLKMDEVYKNQNGELSLSLTYFIPDFVIDEQNRVRSRSIRPRNPAVFIEGEIKNNGRFSGWLFARFPDFQGLRFSGEGIRDLNIRLTDLSLSQYSVIQAAKDPGVNTVWIGCAVVMAGLFLSFYWPSRDLFITVSPKGARLVIRAGISASKGKEQAARELKKALSKAGG